MLNSQTNPNTSETLTSSIYTNLNLGNDGPIQNILYKPNSINWKKRQKSKRKYKNISNMTMKVKKKNYNKIAKKIGKNFNFI